MTTRVIRMEVPDDDETLKRLRRIQDLLEGTIQPADEQEAKKIAKLRALGLVTLYTTAPIQADDNHQFLSN